MVRKMQNQGTLPLIHVGRAARVRQSDLDAYIAQQAAAQLAGTEDTQ
jgi:hypothetical protein